MFTWLDSHAYSVRHLQPLVMTPCVAPLFQDFKGSNEGCAAKKPLAGQSGHAGVSARPEQCWLDGAWADDTSYTAWIRNLRAAGSDFCYVQVIIWVDALS